MVQKAQKKEIPVWQRRHREWFRRHRRWRWLWDSYVGGDDYKEADYGTDSRGMRIRNLVRHKRDYPQRKNGDPYGGGIRPEGLDPTTTATESDYDMRWARTPYNKFMAGAIRKHLSKIYSRQPHRKGPDALMKFWKDVDGAGTTIEKWMSESFAPVLLSLSNLDVLFTHPDRPEDEPVNSRADELRLNLDGCIVQTILPWDMVWWRLNKRRRYAECLVAECDEDGECYYRHWTVTDWTLYTAKGDVAATSPHNYKRVPIGRAFDARDPLHRNTGIPRYEEVAENAKEFYNRDSELILSDTTQAHPLLQGPDDYCKPGSMVMIGPSNLLPKKGNGQQGGAKSYEGFDYLDPPKGAADSLRTNKNDIVDQIDRAACLTKPAGTAGTSGGTIGQSAESKGIDQSDGNAMLGEIAGVLASAEMMIAEFVLAICGDGDYAPADLESVEIFYSKEFDLSSTTDLAAGIASLQGMLSESGNLVFTETLLITDYVHRLLPGKDSKTLAIVDEEIEMFVAQKAMQKQQKSEMDALGNFQVDASGDLIETEPAEDPVSEPPVQEPNRTEEPPLAPVKPPRNRKKKDAPAE